MFIVLLRFAENRSQAKEHMEAHNAWIKKGFEKDIFLLVGSIEPSQGGAVLAHNITRSELEKLTREDPFVSESVVKAEIIEVSAKRAVDSLNFLLNRQSS